MSDIGPVSNKNMPPVRKPVTPAQDKTKADAKTGPESAPRQATDSAEARITRWFSQAGITTSRYSKLESDPHKKTEKREQIKRVRRMENLERILEKALDYSVEKRAHGSIDADWFFSFIELSEKVYSPGMQDIWGKIFATEISKPGSFSIRTLKTLQEITQREANFFQIAVSLSARRKGEYSPKILYGYYRKPSILSLLQLPKSHQLNLAEFGLPYPDLLTLMDAGLIYSSEIESSEISATQAGEWSVNVRNLRLRARKGGLFLNYYKLTPIGAELSKLVNIVPNPAYTDALVNVLAEDFFIDG